MNLNELTTVLANVSLALSFVVALIFDILQVRVANRDRRERLGMEALRNFQSRILFRTRLRYSIAYSAL